MDSNNLNLELDIKNILLLYYKLTKIEDIENRTF